MLTVFLDLDHTLIESVETTQLVDNSHTAIQRLSNNVPEHKECAKQLAMRISKVEWHNIPGYLVCVRPHVHTFIQTLYLNGYTIGIWTAANAEYARDIISVLGLSSYPIKYLLFDVHDQTGTKPLKKLFGEDMSRVFIVDDNEQVKKAQRDNCFLVKPFYVNSKTAAQDIELLKACTFLAKKTHRL